MLRSRARCSIIVPERRRRRRRSRASTRLAITNAGDREGEHRRGQGQPDALRRGSHCVVPCSGHRRAELLGRDVCGVEVADQPAAQDHLDRVGQADQLVQVGGDQQHRQARRAGRPGCGPRSPPGRRRRRRGSGARRSAAIGSPLISRPTISFCWLPPDSARAVRVDARACGRRTRSTIRSVSSRAPRAVDPAALDARRPGLVAEDAVLPQRRVQQQPVPVPVLGDVADAGLAAVAGSASR